MHSILEWEPSCLNRKKVKRIPVPFSLVVYSLRSKIMTLDLELKLLHSPKRRVGFVFYPLEFSCNIQAKLFKQASPLCKPEFCV